MATLTLTGMTELNDKLVRMQTRWKTMSAPFKQVALLVKASVQQNFAAGGRPTPWPGLTHRQGQPLRDTGRLMASVTTNALTRETHTATNHVLEIGTNLVYANVHQFGFSGVVQVKEHQRKGRPVKAHQRKMKIPARPFLLLQEEDKADIVQVFQDYLKPD